MEKYIEVEIKINKETGEILIPRDHEDLAEISSIVNKDSKFKEFFDSKPKDIFGRKNYNCFCG